MFIRLTATKWRLTPEAQELIGSVLHYMRNEFIAGMTAVDFADLSNNGQQTMGAAVHYKHCVQAIDRMLMRLPQTWDAHKLSYARAIWLKSLEIAAGRNISKQVTREAIAHHGTLALDSGWYREQGTGDVAIPCEEGPIPDGTVNGGGSKPSVDT